MKFKRIYLVEDFPPGFSAPSYRPTPQELERNRREIQIQRERDQYARKKLIEQGRIRPDPELGDEPAE